MKDTTAEIEDMQFELMAKLGPERRIELACEMYMAARESILRSLPEGLTKRERDRELVRKFYGEEFVTLFFDPEGDK